MRLARRKTLIPVLLLSAWASLNAQSADRVAALIAHSPALQHGYFGYEVLDLSDGEVIAASNANSFFQPASNAKLYTTALALTRLGANYKFETEVRTSVNWAPGNDTVKTLRFIGGGDPNLSGRVLPYQVNASDGDPLTVVSELADKIVAAGVHKVEDGIVGVSTRYADNPYPDGWTIDDAQYYYGAPVSALSVNDNAITANLSPSQPGELASLDVKPALSHFVFLNQVITDEGDRAKINIYRPAGSQEVVITGTIGRRAAKWSQDIAVDDPALFAAEALQDALRQRGVAVLSDPRAEYCAPAEWNGAAPACHVETVGTVVASHQSQPLWEAVQTVNKVSQNLHAEMLLREVSFHAGQGGALAGGVLERDKFLGEIGVGTDASAIEDGSGLARQDLTTPAATVAVLKYMWGTPNREVWLKSLPVGGVDGSLRHRFKGIAESDRVHAKTGSYEHVNTLSGYIETRAHHWLAFSAMSNATTMPDDDVHRLLDQFCEVFLTE